MNIKDFIEKVKDIEIPDNLDFTIRKAIKKGEIDMKKNRNIKRLMVTAATFLLVFTSFVVSINMAPAFAAQIEHLPGGSNIVKFLQFNRNTVEGGEITDGKDIQSIEKEEVDVKKDEKDEEVEVITISLGDSEGNASTLSHYEITYQQYPYSALVYFSGVRAFSAIEHLADIEEGPLVKNVYRLVTLDDSAHRFVINFKKPVKIEITEKEDPAVLTLTILEDVSTQDSQPAYSIRSASYPFGEEVAVIEQILAYEYGSENARMLQDAEGTYFIEEGYYGSEEEAQARIDELKALGSTFNLVVEKRSPEQLPSAIQ